jgi:hypothetical protein
MRHLLNLAGVRSTARVGSVLAALVVLLAISATPAHAQNLAKMNIDFSFVAGGKTLEAGTYEIEATREKVILRTAGGKAVQVLMPVITRLGRHDSDQESELVFDKVGGKMLLSEFWFPEVDGYLVLNTPTDHEHRVLGGSRPHR